MTSSQQTARPSVLEPTLSQRVSAAVFIHTFGVEETGISTKRQFMWPIVEFTDAEVKKEVSEFLGHIFKALVSNLPEPEQAKIEHQVLKRLFLNFV